MAHLKCANFKRRCAGKFNMTTPPNELIADKAYDTNATLWLLRAREIAAVIPSRVNRKAPRWCDPGVFGEIDTGCVI